MAMYNHLPTSSLLTLSYLLLHLLMFQRALEVLSIYRYVLTSMCIYIYDTGDKHMYVRIQPPTKPISTHTFLSSPTLAQVPKGARGAIYLSVYTH